MVTIIIIAVTVLVSLACFYSDPLFHALKFSAYDVAHKGKKYMLFSHAFVHAGWGHLLFNMLTLYFFGTVVEGYFQALWGNAAGIILYLLMYITAAYFSSLWDLRKYADDPYYNAVGASGAVSAVLFASILFEPKMGIYIYLIPIPVPGYIFAPLYLAYCYYMAKKGADNIGHTAHFWGAVYGLVFPLFMMLLHFLGTKAGIFHV